MVKIVIFLVIWQIGTVFGSERPNRFERHINFLANHMSGEVVVYYDKNSDVVNLFMEKINQQNHAGPVRLVDFEKKNQMKCLECKWIVVIQESPDKAQNLPRIFNVNILQSFWSTSSNFIYIATHPFEVDEQKIYSIILFLKSIKMILLYPDMKTGTIQMKAPDIFVKKKLIDVRIGDDLSKIFIEKFTNLHGFAFQLSYLQDQYRMMENKGKFEGLDAEYLDTVLAKLNAKVGVIYKFDKSQRIKYEGSLLSGKSDLGFNVNEQNIGSRLTYLYPHDILEIRVLVPKSGFVSSLKLFLQPFSTGVWITLVVVFLTIVWGWHRLNKRYSKKKLTRTDIGFQLARTQITQGFNLASIIVPLRFRKVFVVGFVFWAFVLSQAYQSVMIANLLEPFSYPEINTIEQLNVSGLNVVIPSFYYHLTKSSLQNPLTNLKTNNTKYQLALHHKFEPGTAYVMSNTEAYSVIYSEKNIENGRPIMHMMKQVVTYAPQNYILNNKMPLKEEMDEIIGRIRASGIDHYWKTLAFGRAEIRYKQKLAQAAKQTSLDQTQFGYAFQVLMIGHSLAFVVFIFELIWARLQRFLNAYLRLPVRH